MGKNRQNFVFGRFEPRCAVSVSSLLLAYDKAYTFALRRIVRARRWKSICARGCFVRFSRARLVSWAVNLGMLVRAKSRPPLFLRVSRAVASANILPVAMTLADRRFGFTWG